MACNMSSSRNERESPSKLGLASGELKAGKGWCLKGREDEEERCWWWGQDAGAALSSLELRRGEWMEGSRPWLGELESIWISLESLREEELNISRCGTWTRQNRQDILPDWNQGMASVASRLPGSAVQGPAASCLGLSRIVLSWLGRFSDSDYLSQFTLTKINQESLAFMQVARSWYLVPAINEGHLFHSFIHSFIPTHANGDFFMPDTEVKAVNDLCSKACPASSSSQAQLSRFYLPSLHLSPSLKSKARLKHLH